MPTEILMPALSPTMEEGKLAKWLVREGDPVRAGDVIAEIETDKATMEIEAAEDGRLGKILVPEGTEHVKVNRPIALLVADGEDVSVASSFEMRPRAAPQDRGERVLTVRRSRRHPFEGARPRLERRLQRSPCSISARPRLWSRRRRRVPNGPRRAAP